MMGTMEWLWCLGVLHPMQFFHTLMPFQLSPSLLGRVRRVWARREMVVMSMTTTTLLSAPSLSLSSPARVGRAWVRTAMVTTLMTMTLLSSAPSPSPSLPRGWPCGTVRARRGWAWAREMLRRRACRRGRGRGGLVGGWFVLCRQQHVVGMTQTVTLALAILAGEGEGDGVLVGGHGGGGGRARCVYPLVT